MKISELIQELSRIQAQEGDLDCFDVNMFEGPRLMIGKASSFEHTDLEDLPEKFLMIGEDE